MHFSVFFYDRSKLVFEIHDLLFTNRGCAFDCFVDNLNKFGIEEVFVCDTDVEFGSEFVYKQSSNLLSFALRFLLAEK